MNGISVITTLYNYSNYISDNIKSFLSQDFDNKELIIVDDCSTDDPFKVIKKYQSNNIKYIRHDKNRGYSAAKNTGIKNSSYDILVMIDADDLLCKDSLKIRFDKINEGFDLVHGRAIIFDNKKEKLDTFFHNRWINNFNPKWKCIHAQTVMLRKSIHCEIGLYDEEMKCKADREMWARIINHKYKIGYINIPVSKYRNHDKQMSKSNWKKKNLEFIESDFYKRIKDREFIIDFNKLQKL